MSSNMQALNDMSAYADYLRGANKGQYSTLGNNYWYGGTNTPGPANLDQFLAQQKAQQAAANQPSTAIDPMQSRQKYLDLMGGRINDLKNDPYQQSALNFLQGVTNGTNVPYTDEVKNAILAQQGKGFASAEEAQMQALRDAMAANGGSTSDPSFQAAQRELMSRRQGQNLDAQGQLAIQSQLQNFNARSAGANQLAAVRNAQNAPINGLTSDVANFYGQDFAQQQRPAQQMAMPAPWFMAQMPQPQAAPQQSAPQQAPQTQQAPPPIHYSGTLGPGGVVTYGQQDLQRQGYAPPGTNYTMNGTPVLQPKPQQPYAGTGVYGLGPTQAPQGY